MLKIPPEVMQQIIFYCEANGYGFAELSTEDVIIFMIGSDKYSPNQASIMGAHMLLGGIISNSWTELNEARAEQQKEEKKH